MGVARGDEAMSVRGLVEWEAPADACGPCAGGDQIQGFQERTNRPGTLDLDGLEPPPRPVQDNAGPSRAEHLQPTHERLSVR